MPHDFPTQCQKALKEWGTVVRALAEGTQVIVFRKGGIIETAGEFTLESPHFFLYPTRFHQHTQDALPQYQPWFSDPATPGNDPAGQVTFEYAAHATHIYQVTDIKPLMALQNETILTPEYIDQTWQCQPSKPAYLLCLRVYKRQTPLTIADKPEYGGCKSWIDLDQAYPTELSTPVLDDTTYVARCEHIRHQLQAVLTPQ